MKTTTYLWLGVFVLALITGSLWVWRLNLMSGAQEYSSASLGLEFSYPSAYVLEEVIDDTTPRQWHVVALIGAEQQTPENGEKPPSITLIAFENLDHLSAEQWVRSSDSSNFQLSDSAIATTSVDGREALTYKFSGLYENDAVVLAANDKIYFFSAGWLSEDDAIRQDFRGLLASVRLADVQMVE